MTDRVAGGTASVVWLTKSHLQAVSDCSIAGTATIDFGVDGIVDVDALDHEHLVGMHVDVSTPTGAAVGESWLGVEGLRDAVDGVSVVATAAPTPAAVAMGQAALCRMFAALDDGRQSGLWICQEVLALSAAHAADPRLPLAQNDDVESGVAGLEQAASRTTDEADLLLIYRAAQQLMRVAGIPADLAGRAGAVWMALNALGVGLMAGDSTRGSDQPGVAPGDDEVDHDGPSRTPGRPWVLPVIGDLVLHRQFARGPRSQVLVEQRGAGVRVTITDVAEFPEQGGRGQVRLYLRARAANPGDSDCRHVDMVRLIHDPAAATASATLLLEDEMVGGARFVLLDLPDGSSISSTPALFAIDVIQRQLQLVRLLEQLPVPEVELDHHRDIAVDAAMLLGEDARTEVFRAQRASRKRQVQLRFAALALRVRLDQI